MELGSEPGTGTQLAWPLPDTADRVWQWTRDHRLGSKPLIKREGVSPESQEKPGLLARHEVSTRGPGLCPTEKGWVVGGGPKMQEASAAGAEGGWGGQGPQSILYTLGVSGTLRADQGICLQGHRALLPGASEACVLEMETRPGREFGNGGPVAPSPPSCIPFNFAPHTRSINT